MEKRFINCRKTSLLILSDFLAVLKGDEVNARIRSVTFIPSDKILFLYLVMCYLHIKRKLQAFFTLVLCLSNQMQETVSYPFHRHFQCNYQYGDPENKLENL